MRGLAEPVGQCFQRRTDTYVLGAGLVVGEGHPEELVAEHIATADVLVGQTGPAQGTERPVHGRLGAADHPCQLLKTHPVGIPGEFLEDGEHPVRSHKSAALGAC